ncbi:hypothetical protein BH24CHL6_BH24CHL6_13850 [soil metagenome]
MSVQRSEFDSMADLFGALAAKLGEISVDVRGEMVDYRRGDVRFAVVDEAGAELRLDPEIAEAARRTPSATASPRGAEWVRFAPPVLDSHTIDRAEAWFLSAWREAGPPGR